MDRKGAIASLSELVLIIFALALGLLLFSIAGKFTNNQTMGNFDGELIEGEPTDIYGILEKLVNDCWSINDKGYSPNSDVCTIIKLNANDELRESEFNKFHDCEYLPNNYLNIDSRTDDECGTTDKLYWEINHQDTEVKIIYSGSKRRVEIIETGTYSESQIIEMDESQDQVDESEDSEKDVIETQEEEDIEEEDDLDNYVADIVIDDDPNPHVENARFYLTSDYANDAACIQAALDDAENGDTIVIREGDYTITSRLYQKDKSFNLIGEGDVTLNLQTAAGLKNGIYFTGSYIKTTSLSTNALKGSSTVVLSDASQIQAGDLIKIWKDVLWCPQDYPTQTIGEMYYARSVSGNRVTLNEPLLRDYRLSDTVKVEITRPIEVHIKNIGIQDSGATTDHMALTLETCKDSSITDSWVKDSGLAAITLYSCFNVDVSNNDVRNSIKPGSGYGVGAWSGSAFINIHDNYIENCRHTITGNTNERATLIRDITINDNELIGGSIVGANVIDAHAITINYKVTNNKITVQADFYAFIDGTLDSEFSGNEIYGGRGAVVNRGNIDGGTHIIKDNYIEGSNSYIYRAYGSGDKDTFIIENNIQKGGSYGVYMSSDQPVTSKNIIIKGNTFSGVSYQAIYQKFLINGVNLEITGNNFENIGREGVYIDGNSFTNGDVVIKDNIFTNVYPASQGNEIRTINIQNPEISGNQIS